MKAIYFDMDGTIADLYGYEGWLEMLRAEDTTPYEDCEPLGDVEELRQTLEKFIALGVTIGVISWSAMGGSKDYNRRTRKAKIEWCEKYFPGIFSEYHVVKYGTPKHAVCYERQSILVDDNADVLKKWRNVRGFAVDANKGVAAQLNDVFEIFLS